MRLKVALVALALCSCGTEPSFDERFTESQDDIDERARELDEQANAVANNVASEES